MRKIDLLDRVMYPETLTCKDLRRLEKAFNTIYELFDKCMVEEKK